jgi:nucleoside 2-deoxyribosyltransferase
LKIYFATTVLGDRSGVAGARLLLTGLQERGHEVLTEHLFEDDAFESDSRLTPREIYERDVDWLCSADVVIVEASGSSFGIGFETGFALGALDVPVYLLYDRGREDSISRMAIGLRHDRATLIPYDSHTDALAALLAAL